MCVTKLCVMQGLCDKVVCVCERVVGDEIVSDKALCVCVSQKLRV